MYKFTQQYVFLDHIVILFIDGHIGLFEEWFDELDDVLDGVHVAEGVLIVDERLDDLAGDVLAHVEVEGLHDLRLAVDHQDLLVLLLQRDRQDLHDDFRAVDVECRLVHQQ